MANAPRQLFVEGHNDLHVIVHTVRKLRTDLNDNAEEWFGGFQIVTQKGASNDTKAQQEFFLALRQRRMEHEYRYGLVLDADDVTGKRVDQRWQGLVKELRMEFQAEDIEKWGLSIPVDPPPGGWIAKVPNGPSFGIWLMPDNQHNGGLEAFLRPMVPPLAKDLWNFAVGATDTAREEHGAQFANCHRDKAHLHAFLAWGKEPGRPYGRAIEANDLIPSAAPSASAFVKWFGEVFER
ncbi:MAG: DUF3226 domain-containing protein [Polyangia bacterium]|jgi:hypothetical protein